MKIQQIKFWRMAIALFSVMFMMNSCDDDDDIDLISNKVEFKNVNLTGAAEVPAVTTSGSGIMNATYDKDTKILTFDINWSLGDPNGSTTGMHFHGPANTNEGAPVIIPLSGFASGASGSFSGNTRPLTDTEEQQLLDGKWYLNIHSNANPTGELRGNLIP